jgi:hypothetical protein
MSCNFVTSIPRDECIGDSRVRINNNFTALNNAVCTLSATAVNPNAFVLRAGDTMTGNLTLPSNTTPNNAHAVRRDYVDGRDALRVAKAGDSMSGFLTLHADPTNNMHTANKRYVDGRVAKAGDTMAGALTINVPSTQLIFRATGPTGSTIDLNMPADAWSRVGFRGNNTTGVIYTHGSHRASWMCNGYRSAAGTWRSLNLNSQTGAAGIELDPIGAIMFRTESNKPDGDTSFSVTERMRITGEGNVGINNTNPQSRLDVNGDVRTSRLVVGAQASKATIEYPSNAARTYTIPNPGANAEFVMSQGNQTIAGAKTFAEKLLITYAGSGGVGTPGIGEGLEISALSPNIKFTDISNSTHDFAIHLNENRFIIGRTTNSTTLENSIVIRDNKVGIGKDTPAAPLDVQGNIQASGLVIGAQANKATIIYSQNVAREYTIPNAGANARFIMSAGSQIIEGPTTFSSPVVLDTAGSTTSHAVRGDRSITTGNGLTGGGNLTANRTIAMADMPANTIKGTTADGGAPQNLTPTEARTVIGAVNKAGDTLTGFLTLHAAPTANNHAATKQYADNIAFTYALIFG